MKNKLLRSQLILAFIFFSVDAKCENNRKEPFGEIWGKVTDYFTDSSIISATITLFNIESKQTTGAISDSDGNFIFKMVTPGTYKLIASYTGYDPDTVSNVIVRADMISFCHIILYKTGTVLIKDNSAFDTNRKWCNETMRCIEFYMNNSEGNISVGMSRPANKYYIDGVPMMCPRNLPCIPIEQVTFYTGGLPAKYENAEDKSSFDIIRRCIHRETKYIPPRFGSVRNLRAVIK